MTYINVIHALADPTRRNVFEALRQRPQTVGELAAGQPVSRPAVSQHLKVLREADLVQVEARGNRNLYRLNRSGLEKLRTWLDGFWSDALFAFGTEIQRKNNLTKD